jgi:hypothetical protein
VRAMEPVVARQMWRTLEPFHGLVYLVPEAEAEYTAVGLEPGRMGYFASRSAPMGAVTAEVVIATFYNFQPDLVRRVIPRAWSLASLDDILAARLRVVDGALRRIVGPAALQSAEVEEAAGLARTAAAGCTAPGHPLYAGHASLPWPEEPHLSLWHGVTLVREFRGDGHVAALVAAGYSGCEALVTHVATGAIPADAATSRAWSDEEWRAAKDSLGGRGLLDGSGRLTDEGVAARQRVEDLTDELATPMWERLGEEGCRRLRQLVRPLSKAITEVLLPGLP